MNPVAYFKCMTGIRVTAGLELTKCNWGVRREVLEGDGVDEVSTQRVLVPTQGYRCTFCIEILA